jgi:hypothetical protein
LGGVATNKIVKLYFNWQKLSAKLFNAMKMPALLALATFGDVTQIKSILCSITQSGQGKQRICPLSLLLTLAKCLPM